MLSSKNKITLRAARGVAEADRINIEYVKVDVRHKTVKVHGYLGSDNSGAFTRLHPMGVSLPMDDTLRKALVGAVETALGTAIGEKLGFDKTDISVLVEE